jgi:hypothetical protein
MHARVAAARGKTHKFRVALFIRLSHEPGARQLASDEYPFEPGLQASLAEDRLRPVALRVMGAPLATAVRDAEHCGCHLARAKGLRRATHPLKREVAIDTPDSLRKRRAIRPQRICVENSDSAWDECSRDSV